MTSIPKTERNYSKTETNNQQFQETSQEKILCQHCKRTASNGVKCKGICVADSDY